MGFRTGLLNNISQYRKDTRGQIAVMFAILALPILVISTFSLDYTMALSERTDLLNSLDDAALAAVLRQNISDAERSAFATNYFWQNYSGDGKTTFDVVESSPERVELKAEVKIPTSISASIGLKELTVQESSVGVLTHGDVICMLVLDPDGERSFEVTGGAKLDASTCSVQVNSRHKRAAITDHAGTAKAKDFCVAGGAVGVYDPFVNTECAIVEDPFLNLEAPKPRSPERRTEACVDRGDENSPSNRAYRINLKPGIYCGGLQIGGDSGGNIAKFAPGTYIIKDGPLTIKSGSIADAIGVTFILEGEDAVLDIDNGSIIKIHAPKDGPYAGLAIFQDAEGRRGNTTPDAESIIRAGGILNIVGTVYLPTQKISFQGGSLFASQAPATSFIGFHISIGDGARIQVAVDHETAGLPPIQPRSDEGARLAR